MTRMTISPDDVNRSYHLIEQIRALEVVRYDIHHDQCDLHTYGIKLRDILRSPDALQRIRLAADTEVHEVLQAALKELAALGVDTASIEIAPPLSASLEARQKANSV